MPQNDCKEIPAHLASKQHAPYEDKPAVQVANEGLTDEHPTGYKPVDACIDLDEAQLETINPANTDAFNEAENRVESDNENKQ